MPIKIEPGAQFKFKGSDSTIEVVSCEFGSNVRFHVIDPPTPQVQTLTEDEFRAYAVDPATGLTDAEAQAADQAAFNAKLLPIDLEHSKNLEEVEQKRQEAEARVSDEHIKSRDQIIDDASDQKKKGKAATDKAKAGDGEVVPTS